jgi:hypothetical protein
MSRNFPEKIFVTFLLDVRSFVCMQFLDEEIEVENF